MAAASLALFSAWSYGEQERRTEAQMLDEARVLNSAVMASWTFIENEQTNINYDADGTYNFKGIYCSLVGKSIGKIFSMSTNYDYTLSYTRIDPRSKADEPDDFERSALEAFDSGRESERYAVTGSAGERMFRYVGAIYLTEGCMDCHGGPAGETDITGFEKEGMAVGDVGGAVSITMPMASSYADMQANLWRTIVFFIVLALVVVAVSTLFFRRYVIVPLGQLKDAAAEIGRGNLHVELDAMSATEEIVELAEDFSKMATELDTLYNTLEAKVSERTQQYQEANALLAEQREKIATANEQLQAANAKLQEENEYRTNILAIMSHELRTPLTAIIAFTELWERSDGIRDDEDRELVAKIKANSLNLLDMVNNVLAMARLEAGTVSVAADDVDLVDVVGAVELVAAPLARQKNIDFETRVDWDVPIITSDWEQLRQIIENLVSNAIKFTGEGGRVRLRVSRSGDRAVLISVSDTGIGIPADKLEGIFDRFVQVDSSILREYRGSGLGLSLVKRTAEMLGGAVEVESAVGEGSVFRVTLPTNSGEERT